MVLAPLRKLRTTFPISWLGREAQYREKTRKTSRLELAIKRHITATLGRVDEILADDIFGIPQLNPT
jgi:hypothetical protein